MQPSTTIGYFLEEMYEFLPPEDFLQETVLISGLYFLKSWASLKGVQKLKLETRTRLV